MSTNATASPSSPSPKDTDAPPASTKLTVLEFEQLRQAIRQTRLANGLLLSKLVVDALKQQAAKFLPWPLCVTALDTETGDAIGQAFADALGHGIAPVTFDSLVRRSIEPHRKDVVAEEPDEVPDEPRRLESVGDLVRQNVSPNQIAKHIYGYLAEGRETYVGPFLRNGQVAHDLIEKEAATPGSVISPEWVHPARVDRSRINRVGFTELQTGKMVVVLQVPRVPANSEEAQTLVQLLDVRAGKRLVLICEATLGEMAAKWGSSCQKRLRMGTDLKIGEYVVAEPRCSDV
jgi:hypothetical protein